MEAPAMATTQSLLALLRDPGDVELPAHAAKPNAVAGDPRDATVVLTEDAATGVSTGVWECTPGTFAKDASTYTEVCHFLTGRSIIRAEDGTVTETGAGDVIVFQPGWKGTWEVVETVRKVFCLVTHP
jgi:uncharacterized cupin superfamily protein